jgi:hypothetical protein
MKDRHTNGVALLGKSHINDGYIIKTRNTKMYVSVSVCVCEREREREIVPGMWERKREESRRARRDLNNAAMAEAGIE